MAQSSMARTGSSRGNAGMAWARGGTIFAATLLFLVGVFQLLQGIVGIVHGGFYTIATNAGNYIYHWTGRGYSWLNFGVGIGAILTGLGLFSGSRWARGVGIAVALISAVSVFLFLPYAPLFSLLLIAMNIFVIWALARYHGAPLGRAQGAEYGQAYGANEMESRERWATTNPAMAGGRHWATDTAKDTGRPMSDRERKAQQDAMAAAGGRYQSGAGYPQGQQGPQSGQAGYQQPGGPSNEPPMTGRS
jgi:hypothetical protein